MNTKALADTRAAAILGLSRLKIAIALADEALLAGDYAQAIGYLCDAQARAITAKIDTAALAAANIEDQERRYRK